MRAALALAACALAAGGLAASCRRFSKEGADHEAYGLLGAARACAPETAGDLDVDDAAGRRRLVRDEPPRRIDLREAVRLATLASPEYLSRREDVFLAALVLTGERAAFFPLASAGAVNDITFDEDGTTISSSPSIGVTKAFTTGGSLALSLATDFLRSFGRLDPLHVAQSILSADLVLPLARGAGVLVAREPLTQAERNVVYALRDYVRFQQDFTVRIVTSYLRALEARETVKNEEAAYESLALLLERQKAMGASAAGRIPDFQVDQARQDLLRADERRLIARNAYAAALDRFESDIGFRPSDEIELADPDLEQLLAELDAAPVPTPTTAEAEAYDRRVDLRNAFGREEDGQRHVLVAKNGLLAQVDLRAAGTVDTPGTKPFDFSNASPTGNLGLDIDLPLERTAERNVYRAALVDAERAMRARESLEDTISLEVRDDLRAVELARKSRDIQRESVALAERRVRSTTELLEAGRADTRDRLEAEEARTLARNAFTRSVVDLAVTHLELRRDMGTLLVREDGWWSDPSHEVSCAPPTAAAVAVPGPPPPPPPPPPPAAPR